MSCFVDLTTAQIRELLAGMGEPDYRAGQLQHWIYQRLAISFDEMTGLPGRLRQGLAGRMRLHSLTPQQEVMGSDGTVKTLFALADGKTVESTLMPSPTSKGHTRYTVCLSTQVGCPIGCPFCATGQQGFERNLTPGEIIDQVLYFARRLRDRAGESPGSAITNLVFMGMGEPLANYDALWQAIEMLNSPQGFGLGARSMVISTSGLVPGIKRLSQEKLQVGLAVSLHASENALRSRLVPVNKKYPLEELIPVCREYVASTGRRISFEYALFTGVNDSLQQARSLAHLLGGLNCHVNLIAANRTTNPEFRSPVRATVLAFERELKRLRIACTLRQGKGLDIDAGCGQLRSRFLSESKSRVSVRKLA
ncbi:MAG: 23S rRNA (adenine(2503)-C(2))-methyltransferase RlmN [Chloroflexota bacterium]|nr:23S rRNA (adenine(2503)-C(2))-methyltransferase RlmN [Chloroflexota bacterium]